MTFLPTPAYAIQERAVSENPNAGPQGAGWKEEEAYTLEARHHVQMVAAPLTKGSATGDGVNAPGRRQEDDVNTAMGKEESGAIAIAYMPHRTLQKDGSVLEGFAARPVVDALHGPTGNKEPLVASVGVRRLTPRECERLQALPDNWTLLNEKTPDSRRYSGLGDAVTASVAEWIGRRLDAA